MKRKTRKAVVHFALFFGALLLILVLNRPEARGKKFAWDRVRYQTTATELPEARGICLGLATTSKPALVVSRVSSDGDIKWSDGLSDLYHRCVYTADAPRDQTSAHLQVPENRGHEAMGYLTFLIDNYDQIPDAGAVFVHGARWAWHNDAPDYDNHSLLSRLNVTNALAVSGYHNLRCDWSLSTCPASSPPQGSLETSSQAYLSPWDYRAVSDSLLPVGLTAIFGGGQGPAAAAALDVYLGRTRTVRSQCCAQFVVSKQSIRRHSRAEYVALRQWLLDGSRSGNNNNNSNYNKNAAPADDRIAGRILSYVWHILFITQSDSDVAAGVVSLEQLNSQACPRADECYCRLYGRCNLEGCTAPGSCHGQYELPPKLMLPDDWAATHSGL
ncbi:uncharacterized protein L3040_006396 [Drepanopeziza brunnea f. sp. 'multigermtubi']|uniref:Uncharacterized protein n=1 Tax=Marssonina brunnea f. sp. multigermtubi (strain MB_m1) TaxID=1072389 RepID=K1WSU1_MARBU|nr:uncharacterized protein MBM_01357 [Drepanopeziza brunnea f. sp. 'multigermtubi' MB_m1]EKD20675.1 hypothetical protein MBM_01357 [Drepanopeziza brunnea f. sp. 'multigermtubi' MB_m1]KAJ5038716.1 hypothetical protein L3040_006396 [Drepanopeziza brunnea f. sp. 'multigermtubi']